MTKHNDTAPTNALAIGIIALAAVMFVSTLVALVALALSGQDTASIERIVGPLLSSVIVTGVVGALAASQRETAKAQGAKLDRIEAQTNGVLDQRIREGAKAAILETQAEVLASKE